jgi:hypothetical protein
LLKHFVVDEKAWNLQCEGPCIQPGGREVPSKTIARSIPFAHVTLVVKYPDQSPCHAKLQPLASTATLGYIKTLAYAEEEDVKKEKEGS